MTVRDSRDSETQALVSAMLQKKKKKKKKTVPGSELRTF